MYSVDDLKACKLLKFPSDLTFASTQIILGAMGKGHRGCGGVGEEERGT